METLTFLGGNTCIWDLVLWKYNLKVIELFTRMFQAKYREQEAQN